MTKFSSIKSQIEILELKHQHEIAELQMKHRQQVTQLKRNCTHEYDDGTSARRSEGVQWDYYYRCEICNKLL